MQAIPYWHVDAFAARPFSGNQAAVMLFEEWLPDDVLRAIAAEHMFAETAFLRPVEGDAGEWELRWFTPIKEVALCGHATLASGHVLIAREGVEQVRLRTRQAGVLEVRRAGQGYEVALPAIPTHRTDWPQAAALLGAHPLETWRSDHRYSIFLLASEAEVHGLEPAFGALAALGDDQFICTARGERSDIVSRVFVPGAGVDEDSVTGSAHAALAPFWAARLGRDVLSAHQASARGGDLALRLEGERVWLGGPCVTVVEGRFYLSG